MAIEGEERTIRHVKLKVWRDFFAKFGMVEVQLSMSSKYQAKLILNNFACGNSCTLDMDGESLIVGWKGIPTQSLSVIVQSCCLGRVFHYDFIVKWHFIG